MEFRLLGPVEVWTGGARLDIGPPRQRAVLAVLLAEAGQLVLTESLIDRVWGEHAPAAARDSLYVYVTRLRGLLKGSAVVVKHSAGYVLEVEPETVDLHRFRRLCQEHAYEPAFALWGREPLADVGGDWADHLRRRLHEEHLEARLQWAQECLSRGEPGATIGPLMDLAAANPYAESVTVALMRSLAAADRVPEALECFAKMRRRLADELGTGPGSQLAELHVELLRADPARVNPPGPTPRQLPADVSGFIGRSAELSTVTQVLETALATGQMPVVCIRGAPGVGKSTFAIHLAHRLAPRFADGQLYVNLHGASTGLSPLSPIEVMGRFLRALGLEPSRLPVEADEAAALLRSTLAGKSILVVLDDAADVDQVCQLLPGTAGCAVLLTSRRMLSGLPDLLQLKLEMFEPADSAALLRRLCGTRADDEAAAANVARLCGGLPLALRIAATRLNSRPSWQMTTLAEHLTAAHRRLDALNQPDASVRASFAVSYEELRSSKDRWDREAAEILPLLGIVPGDDLSLHPVASLLAGDPETTATLFEHLVDASLLECRTAGRYRLHDLLRLYSRELAENHCTAAERAEALNRLLRFYISTAWATTAMVMPGSERLEHIDPAWAGGGLSFATAAEALNWWEAERLNVVAAALQTSALPGAPDTAVSQLAQAMVGFFRVRGYVDDYLSLNLVAARGALRSGDRAAYATALADLGVAYDRKGDLVAVERHQTEAIGIFADLGDRRSVAACRSQLGILYGRLGRFADAARCHEENLAYYRETGDQRGQAVCLNNLGVMNQQLHRPHEALDFHTACLDLRRGLGDRRGEAIGFSNIGLIHDELGDLPRATEHQERALELFRELGDLEGEAHSLKNLGATFIKAQRCAEGETVVWQADELFHRLTYPFGQAQAHHQAALGYLHHGQATPARPHLLLALKLYEQVSSGEAAEIRKLLDDQ